MPRIVLDTNILVAALIRGDSISFRLYEAWQQGKMTLVTSAPQLAELERVMAYPKLRKFIRPAEAQEMIVGLSQYAVLADNLPVVAYSSDPDDNRILATAIAGKAQLLVTGDKRDLLGLSVIEGIPVVTAREAVKRLGLIES